MRARKLPFLAATVAAAESEAILPMPATPLYLSECGSCHTAYAPAYLPASSWRRLMSELDRHFGDDASLNQADRELIAGQLQAMAMDSSRANRGIAARNGSQWAAESPLRISTSPFFRYMHDEVPNSIWQRPKIASKANCGACHSGADAGRYPEAEIQIPK